VIPGADRPLASLEEAREVAASTGYPILLKAAAGGGGKGMRLVHREADLAGALRDASSEAERAFKNGDVYIEKAILRPRHIEIQIFGDHHGNLVYLGERECSLQRRHQKVIEECPSPLVAQHPSLRQALGEAALKAGRAAGYYNAGTVEFLVDEDLNFYFLEMNTRLQVEHPVTELVTGLDLVHLQLRVAAGEPLLFTQQDVTWRGWAIECRIYAEDPHNGFLPSPGKVTRLDRPAGPGIRLDSGVYLGWTVPMEYDPLLAKLATWAPTREAAIERMMRALAEHSVDGIKTTITFFRHILNDPAFRAGDLHTGFIDEFLKREPGARPCPGLEEVAALVAAIHTTARREGCAAQPSGGNGRPGRWVLAGRQEVLR
jgi:acetyl-CoA carboxylase, biotin carboxylase subunit